DAWFKYRVDDETRLQKVKYLFYTGLVLLSAGKEKEANRRLMACLKTGDGERYPGHRPYLARAHSLLATIKQTKDDLTQVSAHLQSAQALADENPGLLGEIEKKLGSLAEGELDYDAALKHFQLSLEYFRLEKNQQAEALALHSVSMVYREQGRLKEA